MNTTCNTTTTANMNEQQQQQRKCKRAQMMMKTMTDEEKVVFLNKRRDNITHRLSAINQQEMKLKERLDMVSKQIDSLETSSPSSSSPSPSAFPRAERKLEQLKKRQAILTAHLATLAEKDNKNDKQLAREMKMKNHLNVINNKIEAIEAVASPSSSSPSPRSERQLQTLKKVQATLSQNLAALAEKDNKNDKMIQREKRMTQRLAMVEKKIEAIESASSSSPSPSPCPSPSSPRSERQLNKLKKVQANLTNNLAALAEKDNKNNKMIQREKRMTQRLAIVEKKIESIESASSSPPSPSPSLSPSASSPNPKLEQLKKREAAITFRLSVLAKKEKKTNKMIENQKRMQHRLVCVSNKIQSIECGAQ